MCPPLLKFNNVASNSMNNRFDYTNDFSKILELSFYHEFFSDNNFVDLELIPDGETNALIQNYNLIQRKKGNTFFFFKNNNSNLSSLVFSGAVRLNFILKFNDPLFLNISDIPFKFQQKFILEPSKAEKGRLHPQTYVDETLVKPYDENGIIGEISIEINQNNEFFGYEEKENTMEYLKYFARFNSRTVKFRYNFYFSGKKNDFGNFFIYDENTNDKYNDFYQRTLENGMLVNSFVLPEEIKMNESYTHKLYLKKEDEFNKSFSKYLSHPLPKNLKYEVEKKTFYLENFIKIN